MFFCILILFLFATSSVFSQEYYEVKTDSSVLYYKHNKPSNTWFCTNVPNGSLYSYFTEYYEDKKSIRQVGSGYKGDYIDTWRYYNRKGRLYMTVNFDSGYRQLYDTVFVYESYWQHIREKADSIVRGYYSSPFFEKHIQLNLGKSSWYNTSNTGSYSFGNWLDLFDVKPNNFSFVYSIVLFPGKALDAIVFEMDSVGRLVRKDQCRGLYKVDRCCLNLNQNLIEKVLLYLAFEGDYRVEWVFEPSNDSQLRLRATSSQIIIDKDKSLITTRTIYVNPWDGTLSPLQESSSKIIF